MPATLINLLGGSTSRFSGGTIFNVAEYILHPQYNTNTLDNDIAVLRADVSLPLKSFKGFKWTNSTCSLALHLLAFHS